MVLAQIFMQMEINILVSIDTENLVVEENIYGAQEQYMRENLLKERKMGKVDGRKSKKEYQSRKLLRHLFIIKVIIKMI
jgi:hypothetical protein